MAIDPVRKWREEYARRYLRVDFEPLAGSTFHASVKPIFAELRIVRAALSPGFLFRDEDLLRDDDDRVGFVVVQSGRLTARHLGREVQLAAGDAVMMLMSATGGVGWRDNSVLFDMLISPAELEARGVRTGDVLMQCLWGKSDAMQLLRGYIRSLERSGLTAFANDHTTVRRHIIDLMVLATTPHQFLGESNSSAVAAAHLSCHLRPHRLALFGSRTQPVQGRAELADLNTLSATVAEDIGDIVYGTRHRAAAATSFHAAYRTR